MRLTGDVAAEPSDASATLLYDLPADDWSHAAVEDLGLRAELLAPLVSLRRRRRRSSLRKPRSELGLRRGLPVATGAADTAAAMLGVGLLRPGPVQLTIGTGGQIVTPKESPDLDPHLRTHLYRGALPGLWYSMAAIQNAGLALEWVRKVLGVSWKRSLRRGLRRAAGFRRCRVPALPERGANPPLRPRRPRRLDGPRPRPHARPPPARSPRRRRVRAARGPRSAGGSGGFVAELRLAGGGASGAGGESGDPWRQLLADVLGRPLWLLPDEISTVASARGAAFPGRPRLRRLFLGRGYARAHPGAREIHTVPATRTTRPPTSVTKNSTRNSTVECPNRERCEVRPRPSSIRTFRDKPAN